MVIYLELGHDLAEGRVHHGGRGAVLGVPVLPAHGSRAVKLCKRLVRKCHDELVIYV